MIVSGVLVPADSMKSDDSSSDDTQRMRQHVPMMRLSAIPELDFFMSSLDFGIRTCIVALQVHVACTDDSCFSYS